MVMATGSLRRRGSRSTTRTAPRFYSRIDLAASSRFSSQTSALSRPADCGYPGRRWTMKIPVIHGVIDRRLLVNYRVDPDVLAPLLPAPFRPKLVRGYGLVGICLIRLKRVRPTFLPSWLGIASENAAHRAAVEWDD